MPCCEMLCSVDTRKLEVLGGLGDLLNTWHVIVAESSGAWGAN